MSHALHSRSESLELSAQLAYIRQVRAVLPNTPRLPQKSQPILRISLREQLSYCFMEEVLLRLSCLLCTFMQCMHLLFRKLDRRDGHNQILSLHTVLYMASETRASDEMGASTAAVRQG